jgi:phosphate transport system permease protein
VALDTSRGGSDSATQPLPTIRVSLDQRLAATVRRDSDDRGPLRPETRRSLSTVRRSDVLALLGSVAAALSLTTLLYGRLLPFSGLLGFFVMTYVFFLLIYTIILSIDEPAPIVRDRLASVVVSSFAAVMLLALVFVVGYTLWRGRQALPHLNFFTQDMSKAGPLQPLSVGGITHAITGTLWEISIALSITVPLGISCAVFLNEIPGRFTRFVRTITEAMTALPSIVAGLFIYATVVLSLGVEKSGLAAGLAISVEMLPIIIRASDVVLRLVPGTLREAALATGATQWRTVMRVVLPTARSGLTTAVILGTARGIGETSPVLLTAGFTSRFNSDPLHGPMNSLPLATFFFVKSPQKTMIARGFGTAAVLMLLVLLLFTIARLIGGRSPGDLTKRQRKARISGSKRDLARIQLAAQRRTEVADETDLIPGLMSPGELDDPGPDHDPPDDGRRSP